MYFHEITISYKQGSIRIYINLGYRPSDFLVLRPRDKVYEKMCLCQIAMWSEKFSDPTSPRSPANLHAVVEHALQELDMAVTFEYKDKLLQIFIKLAPEVRTTFEFVYAHGFNSYRASYVAAYRFTLEMIYILLILPL